MNYRLVRVGECKVEGSIDFDEMMKGFKSALDQIMAGNMGDEEIIEYSKAIISAAKPCKGMPEALFWGFDEPENMPSDSRVYYFYNPSYLNVSFLIKAFVDYKEIVENIPGFMETLSRGLWGSTGRAFNGHGFDGWVPFLQTVDMLISSGADVLVEEFPELCEAFTIQLGLATGFIRDFVELGYNGREEEEKGFYDLYRKMQYRSDGKKMGNGDWEYLWKSDIDERIRPAIITLNKKGYKTTACCEGHPERTLDNRGIDTYILFANKYDFPIAPPFSENTSGIKCKVKNVKSNRRGTVIYWDTRGRVKFESKVADHEKIIEAIYKWVEELPEINLN